MVIGLWPEATYLYNMQDLCFCFIYFFMLVGGKNLLKGSCGLEKLWCTPEKVLLTEAVGGLFC